MKNNQNDKPQDPDPEIKDEQYFAKILELKDNYTFDDVKTSYKNKMKDYHPDKVASLADEFRELAEEKSKILNEAYDFFKNKFKTK